MSRKGSIGSIMSTSTVSVTSIHSNNTTRLQPCSASSEFVLHAQGSSILCLRHESLALEQRFERHTEDVTIISVDNASNTLPPRVVSIDSSKTAIVWDLETGDEISRFTSFEDIRVASWMKNGNLVFGDVIGNVILFDPLRAESISARTIFDPLCAIAPSADCKSFALGYNNGSVLMAALSPSFTILHTLTTTSLSPSPIMTLAWHASSSKQKSDMLAVQTRDGDLRIWSVPRSLLGDESARVVRVLKRTEGNGRGNNWLGWSRNGRIVQYSAGAVSIWDVRTKNISCEEVPISDNVVGICLYGAKGALFTFGRDNTVQQFTLYPPQLLSNVQHIPTLPPLSPPVSIEEKKDGLEQQAPPPPEEDYMIAAMSPLGQIAHELEQNEYIDPGLGISNVPEPQRVSISSRSSSGSIGSRKNSLTMSSKGPGTEYSPATTISPAPGRNGSITSQISQASTRKLHPLRQEIHPSHDIPQQVTAPSPITEVTDIFANLRARMSAVRYESPRIGGPQNNLSEDDHRREMLFCIFGWKGDIDELIDDELGSVNARSINALILRMWLGDLDQNTLAVMIGTDFNVSGDWLLLALSAMGGQNSWTHVVRAFVMRLLQKNDIHTAVLCLLAIGDKNDAVEVYVSHKRYLEAVMLTSLLWKKDWKRISQLVRKWGEHAAESHDGTLAARCFACAGTGAPSERPQPRSRTPSHSHSRSDNESSNTIVRGLSISSPSNPRTTLKMTPKNAPLKLITSFPTSPEKDPIQRSATTSPSSQIVGMNRFFSGGPPRSATSTPIAMSALTPVDPFWAQRDPFPPSTRTGTPGVAKLTPVTEASPADRTPVQRLGMESLAPPIQEEIKISSPIEARNSGGFSESKSVTLGDFHKMERAPTPPRNPTPPVQTNPPSRMGSPVIEKVVFGHDGRGRSGSLRSKPSGLQIQWPPMDNVLREKTPAPEGKGHQRKGSRNSPPIPPRRPEHPKDSADLGNFLDLLEKGQKRLDTQRASPRGTPQLRERSPERTYPRRMSVERERGRPVQAKTSAMRSPSSPLPFSPQAALYRDDPTPVEIDSIEIPRPSERPAPRSRSNVRDNHPPTFRSPFAPNTPELSAEQAAHYNDSRRNEREDEQATHHRDGRRNEREEQATHYRDGHRDERDDEFDDERYYTSPRLPSRNRSRGRSRVKEVANSHIRSPSSPLPMSPQALFYQEMSAEVDRQHEEDERRRPRRRPTQSRSRLRTGSHAGIDHRVRGQQFQQSGIRRSRSERALRQWSDQLEYAGQQSLSRGASPAPSVLSRNMSTRGLPSNPRAWRAELQASSRSNSPAAPRGRSPAMAPAPPPPHSRQASPMGRNMSPMGRNMSPMGRTMSPMGRTMSPARRAMSPSNHRTMSSASKLAPYNQSISRPTATSEVRRQQTPPVPPRTNQYYSSPNTGFAEYESIAIGSPMPVPPEIPPLPSLSRSGSQHQGHHRNNSEPVFKPLIRKLPPQPPPDSPPPLPQDFPVHMALQMHLDPGRKKNGDVGSRGRSIRRVQRTDELSPIEREGEYTFDRYQQEQSIMVGIDPEEAGWGHHQRYQGQYPNPEQYYEEMQQMQQQMRARHARSPSPSGVGGYI